MFRRPGHLDDRPPVSVALNVQAARNLVVQIFGLGMVSLAMTSVVSWPLTLAWTVAQAAVLTLEDWLLRRGPADRPDADPQDGDRLSAIGAPLLRIAATSLYAIAAMNLIWRGGPVERMFAFALMSVSMVHVLMRYYRSRLVLLASLSPHVAVLGLVAVVQARNALAQHHWLGATLAGFTLLMFAVQFWYARAQLAASWTELMDARQAAEERERAAEAANRAKSEFLATMSHELRTPLNGVLGMAQALTSERLTPIQQERVKIIRRSSESLLAVLNDLLDLSKIESHALELDIGEFDLEHLVRGVVAAYEPLARKKGLGFAFEIEAAARGSYLGDSARIRRILYSLADNAVKFTEAGGVTLSVEREAEGLVFRVDDSGIGIDEANLSHLFEGFFQADASLSRPYGGAGLGLALCREMSSLMGGSIEAISERGAGSTFIVRLPMRPTEPVVRSEPAGQTVTDSTQGAGIRVLAAEDNDTNQLVLKTLLAQAGVDVVLVGDGSQAVEAWRREPWDVILMDVQMPVMDGVAATRAIRELERETGRARTPIVAVTANAMTHQVAEYEAAGMDGIVPKPIDIMSLLKAVERALEPRQARAGEASAA
ncbi:MAG: ATP-binding protein [Phenylobacterium sp.]